jgi:hypothetical protein
MGQKPKLTVSWPEYLDLLAQDTAIRVKRGVPVPGMSRFSTVPEREKVVDLLTNPVFGQNITNALDNGFDPGTRSSDEDAVKIAGTIVESAYVEWKKTHTDGESDSQTPQLPDGSSKKGYLTGNYGKNKGGWWSRER